MFYFHTFDLIFHGEDNAFKLYVRVSYNFEKKKKSLPQVLFLFSFIPAGGDEVLDKKEEKMWVVVLGWCITCSSIMWIPLYICYMFITSKGTFKEVIF